MGGLMRLGRQQAKEMLPTN